MYTVSLLLLYYFFYSSLGWLCESIYCSIGEKKWVNRGFLTGPLCPIYGTGAVVFIVCLGPLKEYPIPVSVFGLTFSITPVLVLLAGMVLADMVEFATSVIMEKLFHARWWDYSEKPFNIQGRICLQHTMYWGIFTIVFLYLIHPFFQTYAERIPEKTVYIILIVVLLLFVLDLINAVRTAMDVKKVMDKVRKLTDTISKTAKDMRQSVETKTAYARRLDRYNTWKSDMLRQMSEVREVFETSLRSKKVDKEKFNRLIKGYPNLNKVAKEQLNSLEDLVAEIKRRITDNDEEMY